MNFVIEWSEICFAEFWMKIETREMSVLDVTHWEIVGAVAAHQCVLVLQFQRVRLALTVSVLVLQTQATQLLIELQEPEVLFVCERRCGESQSCDQKRSGEVWIRFCVIKDRRGI